MTDLDPKIWENETLGVASHLPYLDEVEQQMIENRRARAEKRKPEVLETRPRFSPPDVNITLRVSDNEATNKRPVMDPITEETELVLRERMVDERNEAEKQHSDSLHEDKTTEEKEAIIPEQAEESEKEQEPVKKDNRRMPATKASK